MERRTFLLGLIAAMAMTTEGCGGARQRHRIRHRRRVRRRVRRRRRRRIRRRVSFRVMTGRNVLVVPTAVAVGWELTTPTRVVVVREIRPTTIVVVDASGGGNEEEIEFTREDTAENAVEEEGTALAENDTTSPYREVEEDEEVDEEEAAG